VSVRLSGPVIVVEIDIDDGFTVAVIITPLDHFSLLVPPFRRRVRIAHRRKLAGSTHTLRTLGRKLKVLRQDRLDLSWKPVVTDLH
jgi:hypothetical protein